MGDQEVGHAISAIASTWINFFSASRVPTTLTFFTRNTLAFCGASSSYVTLFVVSSSVPSRKYVHIVAGL
jgi:hypothetical protein